MGGTLNGQSQIKRGPLNGQSWILGWGLMGNGPLLLNYRPLLEGAGKGSQLSMMVSHCLQFCANWSTHRLQ